jgi:hypothetical protein
LKRLLAAASLAAILSSFTFAQQPLVQPALVMQPLITQAVDETRLTVLKGNTHPLARPQFDLGTAPATLPMQRMLLVLKRSAQEENALRALLDNQQDRHSPSYHKWLTPEQFGTQFGPADSDIQIITTWLQSHGFQVGTTKGRTQLEFSGSASQVQEAFHTTIHKYVVNGEQHWANASDPSIPTALTPAVAGVLTLHNFLKKPALRLSKEPARAKLAPGKKPQVTFPAQNGQPVTYALAPQDFAVIYDANPSYTNGISGGGITIGVVGRSNLYSGAPNNTPGEDVQSFQQEAFGMCCSVFSSSNVVLNGPDPGDLGGGEEAEATLDSTWSGAVAPNATVKLVVSASTNTSDGTDLSEVYIVENNFADIMTESFSACELQATDAQLAFSYGLAEQAAAQGITYFVSAGDDGAEGCDDPSNPPAANPVSVNLLASTPFNVAVGGTMFNENGQDSKYWGTEPPVEESAISYIPENVWNESSATAGLWSGSGGASSGNIQHGGTTQGVPKPSWQSGVQGIPSDGVRDVPDVSLSAAQHDSYLICLEGSCFPDSKGEIYIYFAAGTSASAPSFAGIMALVDQQMGGRQGLANYVLYRLAASQSAYPSQCNGSSTATPPASTCIFNDVTVGNNAVPGELNYGSITADYQAGVGYDETTGLGSVNIANLVSQWNSVTFNPTTTTLTVTPASIVHGTPVSLNIAVAPAPNSGTGTPTGDVSLIAVDPSLASSLSTLNFLTLGAGGSVAGSTSQLPGGVEYSLYAHYAGDANFAASDSVTSSITVTPENSTTTLSVFSADAQGNPIPFSGGPFGSFVYLRADVFGLSGQGTPTGTVNFTDGFGTIPGGSSTGLSLLLNSGSSFQGGANTATPNGVLNFDTGTHTISASYIGDASFNASSTTQSLTFTITPGFFVVPASQGYVTVTAPGSAGTVSLAVANSTGFSGSITLSCSGLPVGAKCTFSPSTVTAAGTLATTASTMTITTTAATTTAAQLPSPAHAPFSRWLAMGIFAFFSVVMVGSPTRRRSTGLLLLVAVIAFVPACGGGGNSATPPPVTSNPTPAGSYNLVVSATSGATSSTTAITLYVQ